MYLKTNHGHFYHVDETIKLNAKSRICWPPPAQSMEAIRTGRDIAKNEMARKGVLKQTDMKHSQRCKTGELLQYCVLTSEEDNIVGSPATLFSPLTSFHHASDVNFVCTKDVQIETVKSPEKSCFGSEEALKRMAEYDENGGIWGLFNRRSSTLDTCDVGDTDIATTFDMDDTDIAQKKSQEIMPVSMTSVRSTVSRLETFYAAEEITQALSTLGTAHATMAKRYQVDTPNCFSRPVTQAARDEDEATCKIMVTGFQKGKTTSGNCTCSACRCPQCTTSYQDYAENL
jgi:hypothetical protein